MRRGIDHVRVKALLSAQGPKALVLGRFKSAEKTDTGGILFKAFDKPILTLQGRQVVLDLCGHWSPSVTRAMREYAEVLGYDIKPSLTKGKFTASYRGTIHHAGYDNKITIEV